MVNGEWLLSLNTTMLSLLAPSFSPLHVEVYGSYSESSRRSSKRSNMLRVRPSRRYLRSCLNASHIPVDTISSSSEMISWCDGVVASS